MTRWLCLCLAAFLLTVGISRADVPTTGPTTAAVLYIGAPGQFPNEYESPLLIRELSRQAFLIAARDEMGLYTRDAVLREWEPTADWKLPADAQGKPAVLIDTHWDVNRKTLNSSLYVMGADKTKVAGIPIKVAFDKQNWPSVADCLTVAEPLSRKQDVDLLIKLGYTPQIKAAGTGPVPENVDALLYQTTSLAPFSALQQTDALIRESGESPARLGALVRGYANLGMLTRFQWSSIHKVMTARSLLYAQRMVQKNPNSPLAYYHRAYAFTFAGLHAAALADLATAADLQSKGQPAGSIPDWVALLEPTCKYDLPAIKRVLDTNDRRAPLAALLWFTGSENCGSAAVLGRNGELALKANPACFPVIDALAEHADSDRQSALIGSAPNTMMHAVLDDVRQLPTLPAAVQKAVDQVDAADETPSAVLQIAPVCKALVDSTDLVEPSYAAAGRILDENNFMMVMHRTIYQASNYELPRRARLIEELFPLVADHPFRDYIRCYAQPPAVRCSLLHNLDVIDPQNQMSQLMYWTNPLGKVRGHMVGLTAWYRVFSNLDGTACDLEPVLLPYKPNDLDSTLTYARRTLEVSPYSPVAMAVVIRLGWKTAEPHVDEWTRRFPDDPGILVALGNKYRDIDQPKKAVPVLTHLTEIDPDIKFQRELASAYLEAKDEDHWLSTLKAVLEQPDDGKKHSDVEDDIAWHYMYTGRYEVAREWADAAIKDGQTRTAFQAASKAAEYLGDFDAAEALRKTESARFNNFAWFLWCKRTGQGDLEAAQKAAESWINDVLNGKDQAMMLDLGNLKLLENKLPEARRCYLSAMKNDNDAMAGLLAADVCAELKDGDGRKTALQYTVDHCARDNTGANQSGLVRIAKMLLDAGDDMPTKEQFNDGQKAISEENGSVSLYLRGRQFDRAGHKDWGAENYRIVVRMDENAMIVYVLSCDQLHQRGEKTELVKVTPPDAKKD